MTRLFISDYENLAMDRQREHDSDDDDDNSSFLSTVSKPLISLPPTSIPDSPPSPPSLDHSSPSPPHPPSPPPSSYSLTKLLLTAQKISTYPLPIFLSLHLTSTSIIPLITRSVPASEPYLLLFRPFYQSPLSEPLLLYIPISIHVLSGLIIRLSRRKAILRSSGAETYAEKRKVAWPKLNTTQKAGWGLVGLLGGHVALNRLLPVWKGLGSGVVGLGYISHGFARHRIISTLGFVALVVTGVGHFVWGTARWQGWTPSLMRLSGGREGFDGREIKRRGSWVDGVGVGEDAGTIVGRERKRRWWMINGVVVGLSGLWLVGALGVVGRGGEAKGWVGKEYDNMFKSIPIVGNFL